MHFLPYHTWCAVCRYAQYLFINEPRLVNQPWMLSRSSVYVGSMIFLANWIGKTVPICGIACGKKCLRSNPEFGWDRCVLATSSSAVSLNVLRLIFSLSLFKLLSLQTGSEGLEPSDSYGGRLLTLASLSIQSEKQVLLRWILPFSLPSGWSMEGVCSSWNWDAVAFLFRLSH